MIGRMRNPAAMLYGLLAGLLTFAGTHCSAMPEELDVLDELLLFGAAGSGTSLTPPEVLYTTPGNGTFNVPVTSSIVLQFSKSMDVLSTQSGVSLSANGGQTNADYTWVSPDQLLIRITPSLSTGKRYEVQLSKSLTKDLDGIPITANYFTHFYTEGAGGAPYVVSSTPAPNGSIVTGYSVSQNPSVTFSRAMDRSLTQDAVTLSGGPAVFVKRWSADGRTLTLDLTQDLDANVTYKLNVSTSAAAGGVNLSDSYTVLFNTGTDTTQPDVTITATPFSPAWPTLSASPALNTITGVSRRDRFQFVFTEPMNQSSTISAISFNPAISGVFNWVTGSILEFTPDNFLTQGQTYRLQMSSSATDSGGLPLANGYIVDFTPNSVTDSQPVLLAATNGITPPATPQFTLTTATENQITINTGTAYDYQFNLLFTTSGTGVALKTSGTGDIFSQISFEYHGGPSSALPTIYSIDYTPGADPQTVIVRADGFQLNTQYRLRIKGGSSGVQDIYGNYLANDVVYIVRRL